MDWRMKKNQANLISYLVALGLSMVGVAVLYYAFELVSVPNVKEYDAGWWVILGLIIIAVSIGFGVFKFQSARKQAKSEQVTSAPVQ